MKRFNEWLKEKQEFELWENAFLDESFLDIIKGLANTGVGAFRTGSGFMTVGDEALAKLMGQGTKGRMKDGADEFKKGLRQMFIGLPKEKAKALEPIKEPIQQIASTPNPVEEPIKQTPTPEIQQKQKNSPTKQPQPEKQIEKEPDLWDQLIKKYKAAKTKQERRAIQIQLAKADPVKYQQALKRAEQLKLRSKAIESGLGSKLRLKRT